MLGVGGEVMNKRRWIALAMMTPAVVLVFGGLAAFAWFAPPEIVFPVLAIVGLGVLLGASALAFGWGLSEWNDSLGEKRSV